MINFILHNFVVSYDLLKSEIARVHEGKMRAPEEHVPAAAHERISRHVKMVAEYCVENLALPEAFNTVIELNNLIGNHHAQPYTWEWVYYLLETLQRQIQRQIEAECFFHYNRKDASDIFRLTKEWSEIIAAFPSSKKEIEAAFDCRALGDYAGCVFHMLRVAELGLRVIARERGVRSVRKNKPIEYAMWSEVIDAIYRTVHDLKTGKGLKAALATTKRRENRETAVAFYSAIMSDMEALRALYRDRTAHFRDNYDVGQATSAITRVKEMMDLMAPKLSEVNPRRIQWGL